MALTGELFRAATLILSLACANGKQHVMWGKYMVDIEPVNDKSIQFTITAETTGWIGIGINTHKGMDGADMFVGWVINENNVVGGDYVGVQGGKPRKDQKQESDWQIISGSEVYREKNSTTIKVSRLLKTADNSTDDKEIQDKEMWLLMSYGSDDDDTFSNGHVMSKSEQVNLLGSATTASLGVTTLLLSLIASFH